MQPTRTGFTLVEVLVVITIIGFLVSVLTVNFNEARQQSRDRTRMADLKQLQLALEVYKAQNGSYPLGGCGVNNFGSGSEPTWAGSEDEYDPAGVWIEPSCDAYIPGLVPDYIAQLPRELGGDTFNKGYLYTSTGDAYKVLAHHSVEELLIEDYDHEFARFPYSSCMGGVAFPEHEKNVYAVYSAGAECW